MYNNLNDNILLFISVEIDFYYLFLSEIYIFFIYYTVHCICIWQPELDFVRIRVIVFNATFNNISVISWRSALSAEETGEPRKIHRPATSHWQTLSRTFIYSNLAICRIGATDCTCSYKSNYHTSTTMMAHFDFVY